MAKILIDVGIGEYKTTSSENESIVTTGLESCVGIALIGKKGNSINRGLYHVHYSGTFEPQIALPPSERKDVPQEFSVAEKKLSDLFKHFKNCDNLKAAVEAVPFMPYAGEYINQMLEYVKQLLFDKKVPLLDFDDMRNINGREIHLKEMVLHSDKLYVLHKSRESTCVSIRQIRF